MKQTLPGKTPLATAVTLIALVSAGMIETRAQATARTQSVAKQCRGVERDYDRFRNVATLTLRPREIPRSRMRDHAAEPQARTSDAEAPPEGGSRPRRRGGLLGRLLDPPAPEDEGGQLLFSIETTVDSDGKLIPTREARVAAALARNKLPPPSVSLVFTYASRAMKYLYQAEAVFLVDGTKRIDKGPLPVLDRRGIAE